MAGPFSVRKLVEAGEAGLGRLAGQLLTNEKFVGAVQGIAARAFEAKGALDKSLQAALATMNLPSRADVEAVEQKLEEMERAISEVEARLARLEETPGADGGRA